MSANRLSDDDIRDRMRRWGWEDVAITSAFVAAELHGGWHVWCREAFEASILSAKSANCLEHFEVVDLTRDLMNP